MAQKHTRDLVIQESDERCFSGKNESVEAQCERDTREDGAR